MGRLALVLALLTAVDPSRPDGDGLPDGALARLGRSTVPTEPVQGVAIAPDGQTVALAQGRPRAALHVRRQSQR